MKKHSAKLLFATALICSLYMPSAPVLASEETDIPQEIVPKNIHKQFPLFNNYNA